MHCLVACLLVCLSANVAECVHTLSLQGAVHLAASETAGGHVNTQESQSDLEFLGNILDGAYGSTGRKTDGRIKEARPAASPVSPREPSRPLAKAPNQDAANVAARGPAREPGGPSALAHLLRAGSSSVRYLNDLVHKAVDTHEKGFARFSGLLNLTSSGVDYLDGLARKMKESYATREVLNSTHNDSVSSLWAGYQEELMSAIQSTYPHRPGNFQVLVVSPVAGDERSVATFEYNMEKLMGNGAGDIFSFALFHYDANTTLWQRAPWYSGSGSPIVFRDARPLCKGQAWSAITPQMASKYDYVWLMDGDLQLDYFSWDLYRSVLSALDPLVSQPAILARDGGGRSTDIGQLRMVGLERGVFPVAREVNRSEGMAVLLQRRVWPALHERLLGNDPRTIWYASDFWDAVALVAALACGRTGVLLVNAAPVRHLNRHDLLAPGSIGESHNCTKGCGELDVNCRSVSDAERSLIADGLRDYCPVSPDTPHLDCTSVGMRQCEWGLAAEYKKRQWSVLHAGKVSTLHYRCNMSGEAFVNTDPCNVTDVWPE
mmetsp:Transcript_119543/g.372460  ORF Transcript_119543/g.372460 Transcript_119543/m.372460 type:complete len:547 (+) Transcript_119543:76-1716(+)